MNTTKCQIYAERPTLCRVFPQLANEILDFPNCGFLFIDGKRQGECNGCGECCVKMPWPDGKDLICRYRQNA